MIFDKFIKSNSRSRSLTPNLRKESIKNRGVIDLIKL